MPLFPFGEPQTWVPPTLTGVFDPGRRRFGRIACAGEQASKGSWAMSEETQATSFADHLNAESVESEAPAEVPQESTQEKPEATPQPDPPPATAAEPPAEVVPEAATAAPTAQPAAPPGIGYVPIAAVQAERAKRQALEAELEQFRNQSYVDQSAPPALADVTAIETNLRRDISEQVARTKYPDYDEKIAAVYSEILNSDGTVKNPALWESIQNSPLPAEAAYQTGLQILTAKKYGGWDVISNPLKLKEAVTKELRADLEKEIRAKVEAEIAGKAVAKSKTITDIGQARSASGASESEFVYPSFADQLAVSKRRR